MLSWDEYLISLRIYQVIIVKSPIDAYCLPMYSPMTTVRVIEIFASLCFQRRREILISWSGK